MGVSNMNNDKLYLSIIYLIISLGGIGLFGSILLDMYKTNARESDYIKQCAIYEPEWQCYAKIKNGRGK